MSASNSQTDKTVLVRCPSGTIALCDRGVVTGTASAGVVLKSIYPTSAGSPVNSLIITARNSGASGTWHLTAWAMGVLES